MVTEAHWTIQEIYKRMTLLCIPYPNLCGEGEGELHWAVADTLLQTSVFSFYDRGAFS